jgi:ssDNA-binding Zn-finger/Zn-ribbon topoisomerase 1
MEEKITNLKCPECGNELQKWMPKSWSYFNSEQQASERAGDYYCTECKGKRGKTGYRYYWEHELEKPFLSSDNMKILNDDQDEK